MKKLAARDYEDLLQCALPVFEGLLPEPHNTIILDLLFTLAVWHALAKLRLHTDDSLTLLEEATRSLGTHLRHFQATTCEAYDTRELPNEVLARRRKTQNPDQGICKSFIELWSTPHSAQRAVTAGDLLGAKLVPKVKKFNLNTFKVHVLGHYPRNIKRYGTTDSYSTQPVRGINSVEAILFNGDRESWSIEE